METIAEDHGHVGPKEIEDDPQLLPAMRSRATSLLGPDHTRRRATPPPLGSRGPDRSWRPAYTR